MTDAALGFQIQNSATGRELGFHAARANLAAQHLILMLEQQDLGILGHLTPGKHHQTAERAAREQIGDAE